MKKKVLSIVAVVLVLCCAIGGTLAWLTAKSEVVTNTFAPSNIKIELKETTGPQYKMVPGYTIEKDPAAKVLAGSEECWLFVKIVDEIAAIEDATTVAAQLTANGWTPIDPAKNIYAYNSKVDARATAQNVPVFGSFKIKQDADLSSYTDKTIVVTAYAIQADSFTSAQDAWTTAGGSF